MSLQSMFLVYLPRLKDESLTKEEYEAAVAMNENNINQNFSILYQAVLELSESINRQGR